MKKTLEELIIDAAAVCAFTHKHDGRTGLDELINGCLTIRSSIMCYELGIGIVDELNGMGLHQVADDLNNVMLKRLPHLWELPCPYGQTAYDEEYWKKLQEPKRLAWEKSHETP